MVKIYQVIGAGIVALPLIFGAAQKTYGGEPINIAQFQLGDTLENRARVLSFLTSRLSQSEVTSHEFHKLIKEQLNLYRIVTESDISDGWQAAIKEESIRRHLPYKFHEGVSQQYITLPTTPLSEGAKNDIADFAALKYETCRMLMKNIGNGPISYEEFEHMVGNFVSIRLPVHHRNIADVVAMRLITEYEVNFYVVPDVLDFLKTGEIRDIVVPKDKCP